MVSCLIFKSLSYFLVFFFFFVCVYSVRESSDFFDLHVTIQFSQLHLLRRLGFLRCVVLSPLLKINCP